MYLWLKRYAYVPGKMAFGEKRNLNIVVEPYNDVIFFIQ